MKIINISYRFLFFAVFTCANLFPKSVICQDKNPPVVEDFTYRDRVRSGVALGGIGAGSIELRKDGLFYNWSIFNNTPLGVGPILELPTRPGSGNEQSYLFFAVRYQLEGEQPKIKLLNLAESYSEGSLNRENPIYYFPWLEAVDRIEYAGRFPYVNLRFEDDEMPFDVEMTASSSFIPHDIDNSALPGVYFDFKIHSKTDKKLEVMLIGTLRNLVAYDVVDKYFISDLNATEDYKYFVHSVGNVEQGHITNGQMVLGAKGGDEVTYHLGWAHRHPYYENLLVKSRFANFDDTENRNTKKPNGEKIAWMDQESNDQISKSSIAVTKVLEPQESIDANFFMNWYFPNAFGAVHDNSRREMMPLENEEGYRIRVKKTGRIGHYYENKFSNINELTQYFVENDGRLKKETRDFTSEFYGTTVDQYILDQVNSHLNTYLTSSILDKQGRFGIREGLTSNKSWGPNVTTDVSLYGSVSILSLFPDLQKASMRAHKELQTPEGEINHGLGYDLGENENGTFGVYERVDLVPNYIQLVLRDYLWTNDKEYLEEMWPSVKRGVEYILSERDLNGDQMPDMHGIMCSYDNFPMYGLASYIQSQWVAAMTMAAKAAEDMGESRLAKKYQKIADKGAELMEKELWNGKYFRLANDYDGEKGVDEGCLTDQLIGQWVAHNAGMGYLFDSTKVRSALNTIVDYSFIEGDYLRNCTWPEHPMFFPMHNTDLWVDQANTPWTGVELAFASFLIYEGMVDEAKRVIKAVDDRYRKAGLYWDHQEFGGHYYRPMSSWAIVNALSGFKLVKNGYSFNPKADEPTFRYFFSANNGTGLIEGEEHKMQLVAKSGDLSIASLELPAKFFKDGQNTSLYKNGQRLRVKNWRIEKGMMIATFEHEVKLAENDVLSIGWAGAVASSK